MLLPVVAGVARTGKLPTALRELRDVASEQLKEAVRQLLEHVLAQGRGEGGAAGAEQLQMLPVRCRLVDACVPLVLIRVNAWVCVTLVEMVTSALVVGGSWVHAFGEVIPCICKCIHTNHVQHRQVRKKISTLHPPTLYTRTIHLSACSPPSTP